MPKWYETKEFKALEKEWYSKLGSDFKDEEKTYRKAPPRVVLNRPEYYETLLALARQEQFDDEVDELVICRYAEGTKIKQISVELKKAGKKCHRKTLRYIIRKYEHKWGVKKWEPHQLDPNWKAKQAHTP